MRIAIYIYKEKYVTNRVSTEITFAAYKRIIKTKLLNSKLIMIMFVCILIW